MKNMDDYSFSELCLFDGNDGWEQWKEQNPLRSRVDLGEPDKAELAPNAVQEDQYHFIRLYNYLTELLMELTYTTGPLVSGLKKAKSKAAKKIRVGIFNKIQPVAALIEALIVSLSDHEIHALRSGSKSLLDIAKRKD